MALFDTNKVKEEYRVGVYVTDGVTLWRILNIEEKRAGLLPLEDCRFPEAKPVWRSVDWLRKHDARVLRREHH